MRLRIVDDRLDLEPVADDPRIGEQAVDIGRPERRDMVDVETGKGRAKRRRAS